MTILLDTSVWIRHFRESSSEVIRLLDDQLVVVHELVVGEIACGSLKHRAITLTYLKALPKLPNVPIDDVMTLIESSKIYSKGIGLIDAQLLASVLITPDAFLWTADNRLNNIASDLSVSHSNT
ncbi:MAG: PIN domain-containing protein [Granulosicoccaceae bacterium]